MNQEKPKTIEQVTDLELAQILQREYEQIIRCQGNIIVIEKEIQRRLAIQKKEPIEPTASNTKESDDGKSM